VSHPATCRLDGHTDNQPGSEHRTALDDRKESGAPVLVDLFGHLPLPLGAAGHEGSTVLVGLNGLRLLSARAWRSDARLEREP
jgi:hypothetical protein